jgi:hypothetical protein
MVFLLLGSRVYELSTTARPAVLTRFHHPRGTWERSKRSELGKLGAEVTAGMNSILLSPNIGLFKLLSVIGSQPFVIS